MLLNTNRKKNKQRGKNWIKWMCICGQDNFVIKFMSSNCVTFLSNTNTSGELLLFIEENIMIL